jgi:ATP-binding cassette subfamily B multidrug efflux pump
MSGSVREDRRRASVTVDWRLIKRLWVFVRPHKRWLLLSLVLMLGTSVFALAKPWLMKLAIDRYLMPAEMSGFGWLVAAVAMAAMGELLLRALQTYTLELAGQNALLDLRRTVFRHLQKLSASFYDRTPIGRLIGRVTTDIESLQELFASGVVTVLGDLLSLAGILVILFSMAWKLTLVTLLVVPLLVGLTLLVRRKVHSAYTRLVSRRSALNAFLHEQVAGMSLTQAFRRETRSQDAFDKINNDLCDSQLETVTWESVLSALTDMLSSVTMALILWYGGALVLETLGVSVEARDAMTAGMTIGTLVAFLQYMDNFFGPLNELSMKYTVMQSALTASDRIFHLLDQDDILPQNEGASVPSQADGVIRFENVSFSYGDVPVLHELSFEVAAGEKVAFVGATGAGKSTILKLLTRLYDVNGGRITLDGQDLRDFPLRELRRRIGIVPQDVFLFTGDILENIRLGHPEISDEAAMAAADELHLASVLKRLPGGYREPVRERGSNLSSGERQLIAFARVLAVAPHVLALDEATSSVDSGLEHLLHVAVNRVMQGRTSIIIAHRLSTIRDVDRIIVLHKGRMVEEGSHKALLAKRGYYWRLHEMQYATATDDETETP